MSSETSDAMLHHIVRVESGAEVTILENGPAASRFNKCIEIDIADNGTLHHVRAQGQRSRAPGNDPYVHPSGQ